MLDPEERKLLLTEVAVVYSGKPDRPSQWFGGLNFLGFWVWPGAEGTVFACVSKSFLFFGAVRLRALRLHGIRTAEHRSELVGAPNEQPEGLLKYLWRCFCLLIWGVPLLTVDEAVPLLQERDEAGDFKLILKP